MSDITKYNQGEVNDSGKVNWLDAVVPQGEQSIYKTSSVKLAELGSRLIVGDSVYRYAKAASAISASNWIESPLTAEVAATFPVATAAGSKAVTLTATSAWTKDQKAEGYLYISAGAAGVKGTKYRIKSHDAVASGSTTTVYLYDALVGAILTTDSYKTVENIYKDVIKGSAATAKAPAGFAPITVASGDYFWMLTYGIGTVIGTGTGVRGNAIVPGVAGVVTINTTGSSTEFLFGYLLEAMGTSSASLAYITLMP